MKLQLLLPMLVLAAGITVRAQSPDIPPPPSPPGAGPKGQAPASPRERWEKSQQMRGDFRGRGGPGGGDASANHQEKAEHVREALKHLRAAGLGEMADRLEQGLKRMHERHGHGFPGPAARMGRPGQPQLGPQAQVGPKPPQGPQGPQAFGSPQPLQRPGGPGPVAPANPSGGPGIDDLRAQVRQLTRQVEELRNLVRTRLGGEHSPGQRGEPHRGDAPRSDASRSGGPRPETSRGGDPPEGRPGPRPDAANGPARGSEPQRDRRPQGDGDAKERRPQGDQPPRPQSDGPRREHRDNPPEPKRDGVEEIRPAITPQRDSVE